jgi:hypothetical protein
MTRMSLALAMVPTVFFSFVAPAGAQHPPSGPQRTDRPSGQCVSYNGQFLWVTPTMLALSHASRPPAVSSPGQYARGTALPFLGGKNMDARYRSTRHRHAGRGVLRTPPIVRPAPFVQPNTFQRWQAPQRDSTSATFRPRP